MNILVSTLYYSLFTIFFLYCTCITIPLFVTIPANPTRISFPFLATLPSKVGTDQKIVRRWSFSCRPCRKNNRVNLNPLTWPGFHFHFWPLHRPRLVPIGSLCDAGHFHAIFVIRKRLESYWSKPWKVTKSPLQFATISPVSDDATT